MSEDTVNLAEELKKLSPAPRLDSEVFEALRKVLPMVAIELFVFNDEGSFGLIKKQDNWSLAGGFMGFNESFAEICQRIAQKEFGVEVVNIKFSKPFNWPENSVRPAPGHVVTLVFKCQLKSASDKVTYFQNIPDNILAHHSVMIREITLDN